MAKVTFDTAALVGYAKASIRETSWFRYVPEKLRGTLKVTGIRLALHERRDVYTGDSVPLPVIAVTATCGDAEYSEERNFSISLGSAQLID